MSMILQLMFIFVSLLAFIYSGNLNSLIHFILKIFIHEYPGQERQQHREQTLPLTMHRKQAKHISSRSINMSDAVIGRVFTHPW